MDFYKSNCLWIIYLSLHILSASRVSMTMLCQHNGLNYLTIPNWPSMPLTLGWDFLPVNSRWIVLSSLAKDAWCSPWERTMSMLHKGRTWQTAVTIIMWDRHTSGLRPAHLCPVNCSIAPSPSSSSCLISHHLRNVPLHPRLSFPV